MSIADNFQLPKELPSLDFIAGLIVREGSFLWVNQNDRSQPVFQIKMHANERPLFELIKAKLQLKEKIHEYTHQKRHYVVLMVRKRSVIEEKIIPVFTGRLYGIKAAQFYLWKERYFEEKVGFIYSQRKRWSYK